MPKHIVRTPDTSIHESLHRGGYEAWVARAFGARIVAEHIDDVLVQAC